MASADDALQGMLAAMRELSQAAAETRARCAMLADQSDCFGDLVKTLSTIDDICRVQRSCLPPSHIVTKETIASVEAKAASTADSKRRGISSRSIAAAVGRKRQTGVPSVASSSSSAASRRSIVGNVAQTEKRRPSASAASRRAATSLEDFTSKLPRKYQTEMGVSMMLSVRKMVRAADAEGGVSLAAVRKQLGGDMSLMQCSQVLEVLCRLGYTVRESRSPKDGVRYFAGGSKRLKQTGTFGSSSASASRKSVW